jgi:2,5-diamino-6-(ribosylamino)-4(3H)-pyrimidinone 5'-phosphate reductase
MAGRPYVWANCAISLDGRLAYAHGRRARLSGPEDLRRVQLLRAESQAILVGVGTVRADDPSLRVHWELLDRPPGPGPMRVILDSKGTIPDSARVLDGSVPTLVATAEGCPRRFPNPVETFASGMNSVDLPALLEELGRRGVRRVLVEGGSAVLASFLRGALVDRLTVYVASVLIGGSTAPTMISGPETMDALGAVPLVRGDAQPMDDGWLLTYLPRGGDPAAAPL